MTREVFEYVLRIGDNALILGQGVSAWCGHAPALEEDIALANTALDLIGQASLWLDYAGKIEGNGRSADDLAFLRNEREFKNVLLVEQPNGDYGQTLMRQFLFDAWHFPLLAQLSQSSDETISAIASRAVKEANYHLDRSADLVRKLGGGTRESHERMQMALNVLWPFVGECFEADDIDLAAETKGYGVNLADLRNRFDETTNKVFDAASLELPDAPVRRGGKTGYHSETFGFLLAEMQVLQRSFPGAKW